MNHRRTSQRGLKMSSTSNTNDSNEDDRKPSPNTDGRATAKPASSSRGGRRRRLKFEETISPHAERIPTATDQDIIFGRGRGFQDHPGNRKMRAIVSRHKAEYRALELSKKRALVESVYDEIIEGGARFLYKQGEEDSFVMVEVPVALQKVRNLLRCKKVFGKKQSEQNEKAGTTGSSEGVLGQMNVATLPIISGGAGQPSTVQPPLAGALSEGGNQSVPVQSSLVAQMPEGSAPPLPLHVSAGTPLLAIEQMRQRGALAASHPGLLDATGIQPPTWTTTRGLPNPFAMQIPPMAAAAANRAEQLQLLQQYQQLRAAELSTLVQSKKNNEGDK